VLICLSFSCLSSRLYIQVIVLPANGSDTFYRSIMDTFTHRSVGNGTKGPSKPATKGARLGRRNERPQALRHRRHMEDQHSGHHGRQHLPGCRRCSGFTRRSFSPTVRRTLAQRSHKGLCGSATNSGLTSEDIPPLFDAPADAPAPGATSTYYIQLPRKPVGSSRSHSCRGRGHSQLSDSMERRYRARRQRYPRQGEEVANGIPVNVCGAGAEHTAQRTAQLLP